MGCLNTLYTVVRGGAALAMSAGREKVKCERKCFRVCLRVSVEQTAATPELRFVCLIGNTFQQLLIPTFAEIVVCRELVFSKYGVFLCTANGQLTRCGLVKSALPPFTIT